jgi:hypothetical protein
VLRGNRSIHHTLEAVGIIEYCNLYENIADAGRAVLYGWRSGILVRFCIFRDNTRDIFLHDKTAHAFSIQDCVFSSPVSDFPAGWTEADSAGNHFGTRTASIEIDHLATGHCETPLPAPTAAPTATTSPTCRVLFGSFNARTWVVDEASCVLLRDCFFDRTQATEDAGAVGVASTSGPLLVQSSTFFECHAGRNGGAIHLLTFHFTIEDSCFIGTTAGGSASVLQIERPSEASAIRNSLFADCGAAGDESDVTIYMGTDQEPDQSFDFYLLHFSDCCYQTTDLERGRGYVFYAGYDRTNPWHFRYSTVVRCEGSTGIHHNYEAYGTIEYCNFYANVAHADRSVLYGWQSGMIVAFSVFNGNNIDVIMHNSSPVRRFEFIGCVFSAASLPDGCFDGSTWGNAFGVETPSLPLPNLRLDACHGEIRRSPSAPFTLTGYRPRNRRSMLISTGFFMLLGFCMQ